MGKSGNDLPAVLQGLLRGAEASYPDRAHRLWEVWEQAVGPDVARRSYPAELRRGRLTVAVENAAWMQQLSFLREQLRDALNQAVGQEVVKEIRMRQAPPDRPPPPRGREPPPPWLSEPLDAPALRAIDEEVSALSDPDLRELLRRVRVRAEQARRHRAGPGGPEPPPSSAPRRRGGRGAP